MQGCGRVSVLGSGNIGSGCSLGLFGMAQSPPGLSAIAVVGLAETADGHGGAAAGDDPVHDAAIQLPV